MITLNRSQFPFINSYFILKPVHQFLALCLVTLVLKQLFVLSFYLIEDRDVLLNRSPQIIQVSF